MFVGFEISQNIAAHRSATIEGIASQRVEFNTATWAQIGKDDYNVSGPILGFPFVKQWPHFG